MMLHRRQRFLKAVRNRTPLGTYLPSCQKPARRRSTSISPGEGTIPAAQPPRRAGARGGPHSPARGSPTLPRLGQLHPKSASSPCPEGDTSPPGRSGEPGGFFKPSPHQHQSGPGTGPQQLPPSPSPLPEVVHLAEDLLVLDVAAVLLPQRGAAHGAFQAADVPNEVVHLRRRRG